MLLLLKINVLTVMSDNPCKSSACSLQGWAVEPAVMHVQEAKRFDGIDKAWKKIMQDTAKNANVLEACSVDGRLDTLRMLSEQLETCQKSLSEYLDTKRCAFPRYTIRHPDMHPADYSLQSCL